MIMIKQRFYGAAYTEEEKKFVTPMRKKTKAWLSSLIPKIDFNSLTTTKYAAPVVKAATVISDRYLVTTPP